MAGGLNWNGQTKLDKDISSPYCNSSFNVISLSYLYFSFKGPLEVPGGLNETNIQNLTKTWGLHTVISVLKGLCFPILFSFLVVFLFVSCLFYKVSSDVIWHYFSNPTITFKYFNNFHLSVILFKWGWTLHDNHSFNQESTIILHTQCKDFFLFTPLLQL